MVTSYIDHAAGIMIEQSSGGGQFKEVTLNPIVQVAEERMIERAIDLIEDAVMATGLVQVRRGSLTIADTAGPLAAASFIGAPAGLGLEEVEAMFQRLAAAASGPSSVLDGVPADPVSACALLVVRELMHHLGFDRLWQSPAQ